MATGATAPAPALIRIPEGMPDVALLAGPAQSYGGHVHEEFKLVVVREAGFTVRRRGVEFQAAPGQLIVFHPDDVHSGAPQDLATAPEWLIMCVSPSLIAEVMPPDRLRFQNPVLTGEALAQHFQLLHRELYEPSAADGGSGLRRETAMVTFMAALASRSTAAPDVAAHTPGAVAETVREYLRANLARNVSLDELTAVAGLSKYRLVRLCTAHFGLPPHKLHLGLRLDRVRDLLRRGAGIAEAAHETGFHDQPHLTRMFARAYGMTPAVYRSRAKTYKSIDLRPA